MNIMKSQPHPIRELLSSSSIDDYMKKKAVGTFNPAVIKPGGAMYDAAKVNAYVIQSVINQKNEMPRRAKIMTTSTDEAIQIIKKVEAQAAEAIEKLAETSKKLEESGRDLSAKVRSHAEKMAVGLRKIQSTANFNELERQTLMLERMAEAMTTLADLEQRGLLGRIVSAMK